MSLQLVSGLLVNTGLGAVYWIIATKYSLLSKIPLTIQMSAFALTTGVQGIFMYHFPPKENEGFSRRKAFEVLAPYLLMSTSIYILHRQAFKANIISSALLGTIQLAASQLSYKTVEPPSSPKTVEPSSSLPLNVEEIAIGKKDLQYFGYSKVLPLPGGMDDILNGPCPIYKGKKVKETHVLGFVDLEISHKLRDAFIHNKSKVENGRTPPFLVYGEEFQTAPLAEGDLKLKEDLGGTAESERYWVLMTKNPIPDTKNKGYQDQKESLPDGYNVPKPLEAIMIISMYYFKTGSALYEVSPSWSYTRCEGGNKRMIVGGFGKNKSLSIKSDSWEKHPCIGLAAVRRFLGPIAP